MDNSTLRIPDGSKHRVARFIVRPIYPIVSYVTSLRVYCFVRRVEILLSLPPISNFCSLSEKNSNSSDVPAKLISRASNSIAWNRETLSKCFDQLRI